MTQIIQADKNKQQQKRILNKVQKVNPTVFMSATSKDKDKYIYGLTETVL